MMASRLALAGIAACSIYSANAQGGSSAKCIKPGWRNESFVRQVPGPETIDYSSVCQPWADQTCCTAEYTRLLAQPGDISNIYPGFSYDQCGRTMSPRCRQFMLWEECFYSCDPYAAYYEDNQVLGSFNKLPLCENFCDDWYEACADDYTCVTDWSAWYPEPNGTYICPQGSQCQTFATRFSSGRDMCKRLWGSNFDVPTTRDPKKCFTPWFYSINPNYLPAGVKASSAPAGAVTGMAAALAVVAGVVVAAARVA